MSQSRPAGEPTAMELLEESVHLLRSAPLRIFAPVAIGTLPFALALLWFVAEMSWSAFAIEQLLGSSLLIAVAFCWKQVWEAVFCASIHERVTGAHDSWTRERVLRMISVQVAIQPVSLVVLLIAGTTLVPFATAVAFFRNLSLYAGLGSEHAVGLARSQAAAAARQNWLLQSLLLVLGVLALANYLAAAVILPQLAKSFFGLENEITRYPVWLLTSTGFSALGILVYVTLEPLISTVYVLRCFHGQSVRTGADIRAKLRRLTAVSIPGLLLILAGWASALPVHAQQQSAASTVEARQIDRSIDTVMRRAEYTWRMPRTDGDGKDRPGWASWFDRVFARLGEFWDWMLEGVRRLFQQDSEGAGKAGGADPWAATLRYSLWILGAVFAAGAAVLLYRQRKARASGTIVAAQPATPHVDLRDESVTADKLPETSWLDLAQQWIDKGDLRLALRAMHLAGLSYLNGRRLVTVQRWKTSMEYAEEVRRRGRSSPDLGGAFQRNVRIFEAGWYGRHEVRREVLDEFARGLEEVRQHASRL